MVEIHGLNTDSPYLALPDPFSHFKLTLLEEGDLPDVTSILSDPSIARFLNNVPEPYTFSDAQYWYKLHPSNTDFCELSQRTKEEQKRILKTRFPFSVIRDRETGRLVGYFSIRRNEWEWMEGVDPVARTALREVNDKREPGDEAISYSIGYYLSPEISSKGLMTEVMSTAILYAKRYMNAKHIQGICRHDNIASRRVMEKNGFEFRCEVEMPLKKGGSEMELVFDKML